MPRKPNREYRNFSGGITPTAASDESAEYRVQGRAVVFDTPTVLFEANGVKYKEVIARGAFDEADLSDVIFNYNHSGKVVARLRNNTLKLSINDSGLDIEANLSGTAEGRALHEEIKGGYIDKMSFSFSVAEAAYNVETHTRTITKIKKLYDVSAVDIPAYDETSIAARRSLEEEHSKEIKALEQAQRRKLLIVKTLL
ncbi:MAG: HK97 family phage prohead protease [Clostridia bacterium]|jgi:HK97 family phage prohead protease|nr:HK97 family phage prohead protease [Clostridia bacterium]